MIYTKEVENMCTVAKGPKHGPAPIPEEGKWVKAYEIKDISGLTHGALDAAGGKAHLATETRIAQGLRQRIGGVAGNVGQHDREEIGAVGSRFRLGKQQREALHAASETEAGNVGAAELFDEAVVTPAASHGI